MILVLTTEAGDYSHGKFIDWLEYYEADYMILTGESILSGKTEVYIDDQFNLFINSRNLTKEVKIVLNRRWLTSQELSPNLNNKQLNNSISNTLISELYDFRNFLEKNLKNSIWFPKVQKLNVNKLSILQSAKNIGLNIPRSIVTNSKPKLDVFFDSCNQNIITKAIGNFPKFYLQDDIAINPIYTKKISENVLDKIPEKFFVSIFQENIVKKIEYRILYFHSKCYAVGILSQENTISQLDSREGGSINQEIRLVKSKIPETLEKLIIDFMSDIDLNIGCLDIIETINGEYFFLEVNPVGQISGYSYRTNLNFEKIIVQELIKIDNE